MTTHSDRLIPENSIGNPPPGDQSLTPTPMSGPCPTTLSSSDAHLLYPCPSDPWFAVQTRYRFENKIASQLVSKGVETFLPLLNETHRWSDRQKNISVPLFSGYVFVQLHPAGALRIEVLRTEGVIGFVNVNGEASPIPARQIDDLRRLLAQKVPCALHPFLKVGQRVKIRGGCLDGLEGILGQSSQKALVISIECIQRSLAISIEGYELELA